MPTYQYLCRNCEHRFDIVQSIHDDPLAVCPECAGTIRRVLHPVGVTFKGSGFYRTDSREPGKKKSSPAASGKEGGSATSGGDSATPAKEAASPATSESSKATSSAPVDKSGGAAKGSS